MRDAVAAILLVIPSARTVEFCVGGFVDPSATACCTAGCGQVRNACNETSDVCTGTGHRGDHTTRSNCCPSAIRASGLLCSPTQGPPCAMGAGLLPGAHFPPSLASAKSGLVAAPPSPAVPCTSRSKRRRVRTSVSQMMHNPPNALLIPIVDSAKRDGGRTRRDSRALLLLLQASVHGLSVFELQVSRVRLLHPLPATAVASCSTV